MNTFLSAVGISIFFIMVCFSVSAQQKLVSGTVLDREGKPIRFAKIKVIGTTLGTSANEQGCFKIQAGSGQKLEISSIGFVSNSFEVNDSDTLEVSLVSAKNGLEKVLATAFGLSRTKRSPNTQFSYLRAVNLLAPPIGAL